MVHPSKRDHIVETAYEIFKVNGFHATSIDEIITASKVSRRTMYNHFPSKTPLVVETLRYYKTQYEAALEALIQKNKAETPLKKLETVFELFLTCPENRLTHGCLSIHAIAEYSDKEDDILKACNEFQDWQFETIKHYVQKAGLKPVKTIAHDLFVVLQGLTVISERANYKNDPWDLVNKIIALNS